MMISIRPIFAIGSTSLLCLTLFAARPEAARRDQPDEITQRAHAVFEKNCSLTGCHLGSGAPKGIDTSHRDTLITTGVVVPKASGKSRLIEVIESGSMPLGVGKKPGLDAPELNALKAWIDAGAPDWNARKAAGDGGGAAAGRKPITEKATLDAIVADLQAADERQRPYLRYYSLENLSNNPEVADADLDLYRVVLTKLINSLSWSHDIVVPKTVDAARTLLRIDLRDLDWTPEIWQRIIAAYPYGVKPRNLSGQVDQITTLSGAQLPYIRVDWFVANAALPPLYHEILQLPDNVAALEQKLGVDTDRDIAEEKVVRGGVRNSGVSRNNRVIERHRSLYGAYWRSYDFPDNAGDHNIFENPVDLHPGGGEFIFNLPNGMQAYLVANAQGKRLDDAPIAIVRDRTNGGDDPVVHNGLSCIGCHIAGMNTMRDEVRRQLETQQKAAFDPDKALALYKTQAELDQAFTQDDERFQTALKATGASVPGSTSQEPVIVLARRYQGDVSVAQAAADAGLDVKEFLRRVGKSSELERLGFGQLQAPNGGIKRDAWEEHFGTLVEEVRLGDYLKPTQFRGAANPQAGTRDTRRTIAVANFSGADALLANRVRQALLFWLNHSDDLRVTGGAAEITLSGAVSASGADLTIRIEAQGHNASEQITGAASDVDFLTQQLAERVNFALTGRRLALASAPAPGAAPANAAVPVDPAFAIQQAVGNGGPVHIAMSIDRGPGSTYRSGEKVHLAFKVDRDCVLQIKNLDSAGNVVNLFPNDFYPDDHVQAGKVYTLVNDQQQDIISVDPNGVFGRETILAFASLTEEDLPAPKSKTLKVEGHGAQQFAQGVQQAAGGGKASSAALQFFTVK